MQHHYLQTKRPALVLAFILIISSVTQARGAAYLKQTSTTGTFLSLSDIHFNPLYDPGLWKELVKDDYADWQGVFAKSSVSGMGTYGNDINYNLLRSALDNMSRQAPDPDFIIITGDFLAHEFQDTFRSVTHIQDPKSVAAFSDKTISFVTLMITQTFPHATIYPVLGNNDSDCDDYAIQPAGTFLGRTALTWAPLPQNSPSAKAFIQTFSQGGSYSLIAPDNPKHRIIALNTTFFSSNYAMKCGNTKPDPGADEMNWLKAELKKAAAANEKVWLVYHILPGIDVFTTLSKNKNTKPGTPMKLTMFWDSSYNRQFVDLLKQYANTIVASFAGHIHMDSFELVQSKQTTVSFVHITPAITPKFGNNPGFEVFSYDKNTSALNDYTAYWLDLNAAATTNTPVDWQKEYSFTESYGQPAFSAGALESISGQLLTNNSTSAKFLQYYNVSRGTPGIKDAQRRAYWCGMTNLIETDYSSCVAGK